VGFVGDIGGSILSSRGRRSSATWRDKSSRTLRFDNEGEPVPDLVERVDVVDGNEVKLTLRRAVFHDGRPVKAEDVRVSLERFVGSLSAGAVLAIPGGFARVVGEREIVLRTEASRALAVAAGRCTGRSRACRWRARCRRGTLPG
jgi:hypothetical protein